MKINKNDLPEQRVYGLKHPDGSAIVTVRLEEGAESTDITFDDIDQLKMVTQILIQAINEYDSEHMEKVETEQVTEGKVEG